MQAYRVVLNRGYYLYRLKPGQAVRVVGLTSNRAVFDPNLPFDLEHLNATVNLVSGRPNLYRQLSCSGWLG